jgi:hypothetical protein
VALAHRVDAVGRRLTIVGKRTCTFDSILDMLWQASAERRWQPEFTVLIDFQRRQSLSRMRIGRTSPICSVNSQDACAAESPE